MSAKSTQKCDTPAAKARPGPKPIIHGMRLKKLRPPAQVCCPVVYVPKKVLSDELRKLEGMQVDLQKIRSILDEVAVRSLSKRGATLITRFTELEATVRRQGDKVGCMVVELHKISDAARDGSQEQDLTRRDLRKASNAVQPRMNQDQEIAGGHLAERNLILERLRNLHTASDSRPAEEEQAPNPTAMTTELMPHQKHALAWLRWRERMNPRGGILADDMGLGKTITMISLIASDRENPDNGQELNDDDIRTRVYMKAGTLVVCPASLMAQWADEVKKHCVPNGVTAIVYHGPERTEYKQRLTYADMVITTYGILLQAREKKVLMRICWRRVILDEAHMIRNPNNVTSRAVCRLCTYRRWALTGTPVHNKMWNKWIGNKSPEGQERLSTIMRCIMLRRTKALLQAEGQLRDLPERTAHLCFVTLTEEEMDVYQKVLMFSKTLFAQFMNQRAVREEDGGLMPLTAKDTAYYEEHRRMLELQGAKPVRAHQILVLLVRLRQVCCHCNLIADVLAEDDKEALVNDEDGKQLLAELNNLSLKDSKKRRGRPLKITKAREEDGTTVAEAIRSVVSSDNPVLQRRSSKIQAVMDCLHQNVLCNEGEKAVVVSQWTSVLSLVEQELNQEGVPSVTLSGKVTVRARAKLVKKLNDPESDIRIMLLSLTAGGVGLNLCGASHLLLLDPHWNPQLEQQAQDRVYRVGQTRSVHIYRFLCKDTIEQNIKNLQDQKLEKATNVLTNARNTNASRLSIGNLKVLFNMQR